MSEMSTLDVHFTVIVIPVLHGLLSAFCESGIIVAKYFRFWVFLRVFAGFGWSLHYFARVILGFCWDTLALRWNVSSIWVFCSVNGH
jgi:hypothetical protein